MDDNAMVFEVDLRAITVEVFQEVDALLAEIEREREHGGPPYSGGIVPPCPDKLAHLIVDSVLPRHVVESMGAWTSTTSPPTSAGPIVRETRVGHRSYDEVIERDRVLARRDRKQVSKITSKKES